MAVTYQFPLLTKEGERWLFLKMNYHKHKAALVHKIHPVINSKLERKIGYHVKIAQEYRNHIANHNLRLVLHIAKKQKRAGTSMAEFVSNGNMSLIAAIDKFDICKLNQFNRPNRFSTYATWAIVKNFWGDHNRQRILPYSECAVEDIDIADHRVGATTYYDEIDMMLDYTSKLSDREREVVFGRFGIDRDEKTLQELAAELGICKERVRQVQTAGVVKLREWAGSTATSHIHRAYKRKTPASAVK